MQHALKRREGITGTLERFFPPPESLSLSRTGIDLSGGIIRFLSFNEATKGPLIKTWGGFTIPEIKEGVDENARKEIVSNLIKAREKIGHNAIRVIIPESEVYVFRVTLPRLASKREMGSAVELQLEESVPLSSADTLFEFDTVGAPSPDEVTLSVSAVPRTSVELIFSFLNDAGFLPVEANTEGRCLATALTKPSDQKLLLIVSIHMQNTVFVIAKDGKVLFSSTSPFGHMTFINSIAKSQKLSLEDAKDLWSKKCSAQEEGDAKFFESIATVASTLRDEIAKIFIYWKTHGVAKENWQPLSEVVLTGGDAFLPGVMSYLGAALDIPVRGGDAWQNAFAVDKYTPEITRAESLDYASLVGLIL